MKHWPMQTTATVLNEEKGEVEQRRVQNIVAGRFCIDQVYGFPVNVGVKDTGEEESVTVHRCMIPAGTKVEEGYEEVRAFIRHLGYCPAVVCPALGFWEVIGMCNPDG